MLRKILNPDEIGSLNKEMKQQIILWTSQDYRCIMYDYEQDVLLIVKLDLSTNPSKTKSFL